MHNLMECQSTHLLKSPAPIVTKVPSEAVNYDGDGLFPVTVKTKEF